MKARKHVHLAVYITVGIASHIGGIPVSEAQTRSGRPEFHRVLNAVCAQEGRDSAETLAAALNAVAWDVNQRGPLLVVNPQGTLSLPPSEALPAPDRTTNSELRLLAARFGRQTMPLRSLTVLAPTTMVVLNAHPGIPNPYAGMQRNQMVKLLMASLTSDQWRALGSEQGLGLSELSRDQQPLFLAILPEPFALASFKMEDGVKLSQPAKNVTLSPAQRADVHLRVNRAVETYLPQPGGSFGFASELPYYGLAGGTEFFTLVSSRKSAPAGSFGIPLRAEVPNRLKPSALAFDSPALNRPVPLAAAKNVGDLVQRVGRAAGIELYADGRVADLPVWIRGDSAQAGDLLQALCLAVTGAVRRVNPAYVLTSDLEGIGTRYVRLNDWASDAQAQRQAALDAADQAAVPHPEQYVGFARDDPFAFSAAALQTLMSNGPEPGFQSLYNVPLASLPSGQQDVIQAYFAHQQKPLEGNRVKVSLTNRFSFLVPNIGAVQESELDSGGISLPGPPGPRTELPSVLFRLPAELATRALFVRPADRNEAARFASSAHAHGLNQLWVEVEEGAEGQTVLKEAIAAGRENHLEVVGVLRLLQAADKEGASQAPPIESRDRNLLDETGSTHAKRMLASPVGRNTIRVRQQFANAGDWLRPDLPATQRYVEQRLRSTASTPGLAGLALIDAAPPGYRSRGVRIDPFVSAASNDFGYSPAMRLAYLRRYGYDPIDLTGAKAPYLSADLSLPFFSSQAPAFQMNADSGQLEPQPSSSALQEWDAFRYKANTDLLISLGTFLRTSFPAVPLFVRQSPVTDGWWSGWNKTDPLPEPPALSAQTTAAQAGQLSVPPLLLNIPYAGSPAPNRVPTSARHFALWVKSHLEQRKEGWSGVVLDLRALPAEQALNVLNGLATSP